MGYKVIHICDRVTSRVAKEVYSLRKAGINVVLAFNRCPDGDFRHLCNFKFGSLNEIYRASSEYDILHIHTSVDPCLLSLHDGKNKVVWDCHDEPNVKINTSGLSACITPSKNHSRKLGTSQYLYSKLPYDWFKEQMHHNNKIIYAGGIGEDPAYRNYRYVFRHIKPDILPANMFTGYGYGETVLPTVRYSEMLNIISHYQYGYAGSSNPQTNLKYCVTNKFWEYLACGIPSILWISSEMSEIADKENVGITIDDPTTFDISAPMCYNAARRYDLSMDVEIQKLIDIYKGI